MKLAELRSDLSALHNSQVEFTGEVVGDIVNADADHIWFTVVDEDTAISVYVPAHYRDQIDQLGRYNMHGTEITVTGELSLDCFEHQGLLDVHASSVAVVAPGYAMAESDVAVPFAFLIGAGLATLALLLGLLRNFIIRKNR